MRSKAIGRAPFFETWAARHGQGGLEYGKASRTIKAKICFVFALAFAGFVSVEAVYLVSGAKRWSVVLLDLGAFVLVSVLLAFYSYYLVMMILAAACKADKELHSITDISSDAVFSVDQEAVITSWGKGAERIFGFSADEALGQSLALILPDEFFDHELDVLDPLMTSGIVLGHRTMYKRKDGQAFPVEASLTLVRGVSGEPTGILAVLRDISEQVWMESELRRSRDDLEARVEERTEALQKVNAELAGFSHTVSHDLKGPLAKVSMAGWTMRAMRNGELPEDPEVLGKMLEAIDEGTNQCCELIDNLLRLAEAGQEPLAAGSVAVRAIVERVVSEQSRRLAATGIEVRVLNDLGEVNAEETHIYQVFTNLIGNAIKHCPATGGVITIERFEHAAGIHYFKVCDNGEGIPEQNLGRIFEPFFKGAGDGSGIGLATVNKIVRLYGGYIEACNDGGACFEFAVRDFDSVRRTASASTS
ncbi:MAG: two-component system sensor histidine kinase NtrB [Candidatus Geothermincolia bacterium]